jgi:cellobiose transport system permease protein
MTTLADTPIQQKLPTAQARRRRLRWERTSPYFYIAPFFVIFAIFGLFPLLYNFVISLYDWNPIGEQKFIGIDNFTRLFADPRFWNATVNTLGIFLLSTVPQLVLALGLAHLLNHARLKAANFFRMSMLVPYITSVAATTIVFAQLFDRDYGMLNWLLSLVGVDPIAWVDGRYTSWLVVSTMVGWRWFGYNTLLYLAALQAIPRDMYEAAEVDGAGSWAQFRYLTIPSLRPVIIFTIITSTIGGLQVFTEPLLLNPAAPLTCGASRQCQTLVLFLYEQGFGQYEFGYGAAIGVVLFVIIVLIAGINFLISTRIRGGRS